MRRWLPIVSILVLVLALTAACGGDDDDGDDTPAPTATTAQQADATPTTGAGSDIEGDAAAGQTIAEAQCFACHTIDGSALVGPSWQGLYGHEVTLEDGTTVTADADYIRESILEPNARIVKGFTPTMPPFNTTLSEQQIADLIAYIQSLQ